VDFVGSIGKLFKLSVPAIATIALSSFLIVIRADEKLSFVDFSNIRDSGQPYLNAVFILSICFIIVKSIIYATSYTQKKYKNWFARKKLKVRLTKLTPEEQTILSGYIKDKTRSQLLSTFDGVAENLVRSGIIYRSSILGTSDASFAHNITDCAWDYLNNNPEILLLQFRDGKFVEKQVHESEK
jgi:hypothetical protein